MATTAGPGKKHRGRAERQDRTADHGNGRPLCVVKTLFEEFVHGLLLFRPGGRGGLGGSLGGLGGLRGGPCGSGGLGGLRGRPYRLFFPGSLAASISRMTHLRFRASLLQTTMLRV
jgi:hypothetical protein